MKNKYYYLSIIFLLTAQLTKAQDNTLITTYRKDTLTSSSGISEPNKVDATYGNNGWELKYGENNMIQIEWRLQTRYMHQTLNPEFTIPEEDSNDKSFNLQRFRMKVGGYAYKKYIKYYIEYDFPSTTGQTHEILLNTKYFQKEFIIPSCF